MQTSQLQVTNLTKKYGTKYVVDGVSFSLNYGQAVGLLGPNGAGKTTTFYMICGFITPEAGAVLLDGFDITKLPMHRRAELGLVYLPQESSIFRKLSVRDNLLAVLEARKGLGRKERNRIADRLLDEMNLTYLSNQFGFSLSGGERRRTEIARALALEPKFLLLDEPFAAIDPKAVADIKEVIQLLVKEKGIGILLTDHNEHAALDAVNLSHIVYRGKIVVSGTADELVENELANKYYLNYSMTKKDLVQSRSLNDTSKKIKLTEEAVRTKEQNKKWLKTPIRSFTDLPDNIMDKGLMELEELPRYFTTEED